VAPATARSTPVRHAPDAPPQEQHVVLESPLTKNSVGGSSESMTPSQLLSCRRPTVGVAQTSVLLLNSLALGAPHAHFSVGSSWPGLGLT